VPSPVISTEFVFDEETKLRQQLTLVALGKSPADSIISDVTLLNVHSLEWQPNQDIVISNGRIAWVGPTGKWTGEAANVFNRSGLFAAPGFGEPHKHIESTHLTPEYEAALVVPHGNTWTVEASHEFSNVNSQKNSEFWLTPRRYGSPLKIFPVPGSATPPTAFESTGGYNGYQEIKADLAKNLWVAGLDEVMDWSAVWNPENPGHSRIWQSMQATRQGRGVIAGHGTGLKQLPEINAFAAAGLASDHEAMSPEEAWEKMSRGVFLMLKPRRNGIQNIIPYFVTRGLRDWSNLSLTTDDRDAAETLEKGSSDYNLRIAIDSGAPVEAAYAMASYYPARHWHLEHLVGSLAPGRFADVVLLSDPKQVVIEEVFADGTRAAEKGKYLLSVPKIDWPAWATNTIRIGEPFTGKDFEIKAPASTTNDKVTAAVLQPYHWEPDFMTLELPVKDGVVERGEEATKLAIIDRYHGEKSLGKMFWKNVGPKTPNSALACSVAHDHHNLWVLGSSDAAMALAINELADMQGGWVLVNNGAIVARVSFEIGGLMTARPAEVLAAELKELWSQGDKMEWHGTQGFPRLMIFATLTCTPWHWVLVVPQPDFPNGFVNVTTGETHPIVW
jgi:adenine deaminase